METSTRSSVESPSAAVVGLDDDSNYRAPSVLAIVSVILGIAAPLAFFAPLLMVIPIAGAVLALMAIRRIASSEGMLLGRSAALIGLVLSVACIAAVFARAAISEQLLSRQARAAALEWFHLVQSGDAERAFALTTASRQASPKAPPGSPEADSEPQVPHLETFRADPVVHFLMEHAAGSAVEYVGDDVFDRAATTNARVQQLYHVDVPPREEGPASTSIEVVMQRVGGYGGIPAEWQVAAYHSDDLPADHVHEHAGHFH